MQSFKGITPKTVSIVIPCFNNEQYIIETLTSVSHQSYSHWECIIVDDGSVDNSKEVIQEYIQNDKRFSFVQRPQKYIKGANSCRNYGAFLAKGQYVLFLDADDLIIEQTLENRLVSMKEDTDIAVFNTCKFRNFPGDIKCDFLNNIELDVAINNFYNYKITWNIHSVLWKKSFFDTLNGFDVKLNRFQDYDLHLRMLNQVTPDQILFYPLTQIDSYYRYSQFHKTITINKKIAILKDAKYLLVKFDENYGIKFQKGFINYIFYQYNNVFSKKDFSFFKSYLENGLDRKVSFLKLKTANFFRFNFLINKIVSKILFKFL